jgi:hypothetical protein
MDKSFQLFTVNTSVTNITSPVNQVAANSPNNITFPSMNIEGIMLDDLLVNKVPILDIGIGISGTLTGIPHFGYLAWFPNDFFSLTGIYPNMNIASYPKELFFAELKPQKPIKASSTSEHFHVNNVVVPYCCTMNSHIIHFFNYNAYTIDGVDIYIYNRVWSMQ